MKFTISLLHAKPMPSALAIVLCAALYGVQAGAAEHVIQAQSTKFSPLVLYAEPGDTIRWKNMVGHDAQSMEGMIPEGAEHFHIPLGENGGVTLEQEGVYVYKCNPHFSLGMAGSIVLGDSSNMDEVEKNAKGMAKRVVIKTKLSLKNRAAAEQQ